MFRSMFLPKKRPVVLRLDKSGDHQIVGRIKEHYLKDLLFDGYIRRIALKLSESGVVDAFECVRNCEFGISDDAEISLVLYKGDYILRHEDAIEDR